MLKLDFLFVSHGKDWAVKKITKEYSKNFLLISSDLIFLTDYVSHEITKDF